MRMTYTRVSFVVVIILGLWTGSLLSACAPELVSGEEHTHSSDGGTQDGPPKTRVVPGESVVTTDLGDGVTQLQINSSDSEKWIYITFAKDNPVEVTDPMQSNDWELGFQRFQIKSNSGVSGKGGVEVAIVDDKTFDEIEYAPKEGYLTDKEDGDDEDKDPDFSFLVQDGWYAYNPTDHTLSARKRVYVVKTTKGEYVKVMMLGYYDKNGNSGFPTLKWAKIKAPKETTTPKAKTENKDLGDGVTQTKVDATDKESWVYFSFSYARDIEVKEPTQSTDWDIAFQRSSVKVNGGVSGKGNVQLAILDGQKFEAIEYAPKDGYVTDDKDLAFATQDNWYAYDPVKHTLSPRDRVYVLKSAEGQYFKLQFTSYYDVQNQPAYPTFQWAKIKQPKPDTPTGPKVTTKDLGDGVTQVQVYSGDQTAWVYYSIETNAEVTPKTPEDSTEWTLTFQRFQIKVNGGISGKGGVEVAILKGEDFDALKTAPKDGYVTDAVDGSDEGTEPDLVFNLEGGWYQYDPSTHTLAPKDQVYVLKQGSHYYKMKILSYYNDEKKSGYPTFKWAKIDPPQ